MSWDTAVSDVRKIMSDGPTDKLAYRKKVIGDPDGTNVLFKTFEVRRVTDFTSVQAPSGVFINNEPVSVIADDIEMGEFKLSSAPTATDKIRASYYYQWFTDEELEEFLTDAAQWIGYNDFDSIPDGMRPAAKEYAAHKAYQKLISKMSVNMAETYQLFDAPDKGRFDPIQAYAKVSQQKYDLALKLRNDVYDGRKGQAAAPRSGTITGRVKNVAPNS